MTDENLIGLRILYTINTSPQYILAKSPEKIPLVSADGVPDSSDPPRHARASLKVCAIALCCSSPELRPDISRDYSVYVLDPLEDFISKGRHGQSSSSQGGVAVGMGLLSTILSPYYTDSTLVTGTIVGCGQNERALEIVLSLRQAAPSNHGPPEGVVPYVPQMHYTYNRGYIQAPPPAAPKTSKPTTKPIFTSQPLPAFNERLMMKYNPRPAPGYPYHTFGAEFMAGQSFYSSKPNLSQDTRAAQFPTPYIGPPKRPRGRPRNQPVDTDDQQDASDGPSTSQQTTKSETNTADPSTESSQPCSSQESHPPEPLPNSSNPIPNPNQQSSSPDLDIPIDLSQSAVILAALSSVSSKPGDASIPSEGKDGPNPDLVSFLRAYLAALESQQPVEADSSAPVAVNPTETPSRVCPPASHTDSKSNSAGAKVADKENWKPPRPHQYTKDQGSSPPKSAPPFGLGLFNSRAVNDPPGMGSKAPTPAQSSDDIVETTAAQSSEKSKKRKLGESFQLDEVASRSKRRSSTMSNRVASSDDSVGRINSGWGGLRVRSDGSFGGGNQQKAPAESRSDAKLSSTQQTTFFRATCATTTTVRKGPYVVPDWARGVPPPAAPPRQEEPSSDKEQGKSAQAKKGKSKSLSRLGGKINVKRSSTSQSHHSTGDAHSQPDSPTRPMTSSPSALRSPMASPKVSLRKAQLGKLPVFAQSSPVAKSSYSAFFQAFQTSPCRPSNTSRSNLLSTPSKSGSSRSPGAASAFAGGISLFTPSPITSSIRGSAIQRTLFGAINLPPSPTPSKRTLRNSPARKSPRPEAARQISQSAVPVYGAVSSLREDNNGPPSSLPVASSDDISIDVSAPEQSLSSDSTITHSVKIHDWSLLDLPPSSPPPPSSPALVPMLDSDLPCSDIPSSDMGEGETPPGVAEYDDQLTADSDAEMLHDEFFEIGRPTGLDVDFSNATQFLTDLPYPDFDLPMAGPEESAAGAAIGALRNGLGQEDLSEAWSLLDNVLNPSAAGSDSNFDSQMQGWLGGAVQNGLNLDSLGAGGPFDTMGSDTGGQDYASMVASSFEDLLKGCLV